MRPINLPSHVKLVKFSTAHLRLMRFDAWQLSVMRTFPDYEQSLEQMAAAGEAYTALIDGQPVMCWGLIELWPGVAEAWMLRDEAISQHAVTLARCAFDYFLQVGAELALNRCQFSVSAGNERAVRFAKYLRFEVEGVLRRYAPDGSDYLMMARLY